MAFRVQYLDSISTHVKNLGSAYLTTKVGTSSATGLVSSGFVIKGDGA